MRADGKGPLTHPRKRWTAEHRRNFLTAIAAKKKAAE
jgi:hypothetical protein